VDPSKSSIIATFGLTKRYGMVTALQGLTMEVRQGEVFGLLGPNGSGKTTTIRLLLGLIKPTAGRALVAAHDCWRRSLEVRQLVSYLPGELRLPGHMTGYRLLKFYSDLRGGSGLERAVAIGERVMKLDLDRKVRTYSTGMKQKIGLALAFADPVDILMLDEPTSALDPSARGDVLNLVADARRSGQTVIFSGHVLSEVEQVADRVAILRRGRLMHVEDMHERRSLRMLLVKFAGEPPAAWPDELELGLRERNDHVLLFEHRADAPAPLLAWLASQNVEDIAVGTEDLRSLYDRFHGPNVKEDVEEMR
jgi:ABC-2 type transport system ATP-binding protein